MKRNEYTGAEMWLWPGFIVLIIIGLILKLSDPSNLLIDVAMFVIMGISCGFARKKLGSVSKVTKELTDAANRIESDSKEHTENEYLWDLYSANRINLFEEGNLEQQYEEFREEQEEFDNKTNGSYRCDIEDRISREYIDSLASTNILNIFPGLFTGLGILGTFIGLSIGLQNFNTGDSEQIANSIPGLMNGIKVAFHTSIYGMVASLGFNYIYKKVMEKSYTSLDRFLEKFDKHVLGEPKSQNTSNTQALVSEIPERTAESFEPYLEDIKELLRNFNSSFSALQQESLNQMVNTFINSLNATTVKSFEKLNESIAHTCEMQEKSTKCMEKAFEEISRVSSDLVKINEMTEGAIEKVSKYVDDIMDLESIISDNSKEHQAYLDHLKQYISESEQGQVKLVASVRGAFNQMTSYTENTEKLQGATGRNLELIEQRMEEYKQFENKLIEYTGTISDCEKQLSENYRDLLEETKKILERSDDSTEKMSNYLESINRLQNLVNENMIGFNKQLVVFRAMEDKMAGYMTKLADCEMNLAGDCSKISESMDGVAKISGSVTEGMEAASRKLGESYNRITKEVNDAMGATFVKFDEGLADITRHLSGTIQQIDDTTGRVPKVVDEAYSGIEKSFKGVQKKMEEVQDEMEQLIYSMEVLQRNMPRFKDITED